MSSGAGGNILSVEMESASIKQEIDLDSISLHSGDYLDAITCDDHEPSADGTETILSIANDEITETHVGFLEKENNIIMTAEESVESSEINSEATSQSMTIPSTPDVIVSSTDNHIHSSISSLGVSGSNKIISKKLILAKGQQNVPQRPLSVSNVTSFKKPATSLATGPKNIVTKMMVNQDYPGQQIVIGALSPNKQNLVKIVSSSQPLNTAKTITMAQAQKLGLLSSGKLQIPAVSGVNNIISDKESLTSPKKVTMVKSPAKILPAPGPPQSVALKTSVMPQRILVKQNTLRSNTGQVIRIPASQMSALGIQKIQIPGSQKVQYVRIVHTSNAGSVAIKPRSLTTNASGNSSNVYLSDVISSAVTDSENPNTRVKMVSLANNPSPVPTSSSTCILLPASYLTDLDIKVNQDKLEDTLVTSTATPAVSNEGDPGDLQTVKLKALAVTSEEPLAPSTNNIDFDQSSVKFEDNSTNILESKLVQTGARTLEPNGIRPRKPCNCTKSMCLKLYCDCFANGEFCYQCNCNSCFNNIEHEDDRHHAIRQCLERNPNAFRPKIGKCLVGEGERRHTKGCNCKRSGCLKNYCECYEAKIPCSNNCKCVSCRNVEENLFLRLCQSEKNDKPMDVWKNKIVEDEDHSRQWSTKLAFSFMSETIVSATCHCLFAQADKAKKSDVEEEELQKIILEECGNCLQQIIVIASKSLSQKSQSSS